MAGRAVGRRVSAVGSPGPRSPRGGGVAGSSGPGPSAVVGRWLGFGAEPVPGRGEVGAAPPGSRLLLVGVGRRRRPRRGPLRCRAGPPLAARQAGTPAAAAAVCWRRAGPGPLWGWGAGPAVPGKRGLREQEESAAGPALGCPAGVRGRARAVQFPRPPRQCPRGPWGCGAAGWLRSPRP